MVALYRGGWIDTLSRVGCVWMDASSRGDWRDALSRGDWMDTLNMGGWMDALRRGGWMNALSRLVGWMR